MKRSQSTIILADLQKKMVLLSGPRQVGKSWMARDLARNYEKPQYLNWDNRQDRELIIRQAWPSDSDLLIFDEIHKMPEWKNYLKGIYDTKSPRLSMLVTGSTRLETVRQSGDSMAGRFFHHRLFPISPAEASAMGEARDLIHFLNRGGFPEPFLDASDNDAGRWRRTYVDGLIREDILDFENIREIRTMNLLLELLRERVSAPLSYQNLGQDTGSAPNTIRRYIDILEALYIVFRIYPYSTKIARSLTQQPKLYFMDTGLVRGDDGAKLENHVAVSLFKELAAREDADGTHRELKYLKTKEGRETDFLMTKGNSPLAAIEVKSSDRDIAQGLRYFRDKYNIPGIQLVGDLRLEYDDKEIIVRKAQDWLEKLGTSSSDDNLA